MSVNCKEVLLIIKHDELIDIRDVNVSVDLLNVTVVEKTGVWAKMSTLWSVAKYLFKK